MRTIYRCELFQQKALFWEEQLKDLITRDCAASDSTDKVFKKRMSRYKRLLKSISQFKEKYPFSNKKYFETLSRESFFIVKKYPSFFRNPDFQLGFFNGLTAGFSLGFKKVLCKKRKEKI